MLENYRNPFYIYHVRRTKKDTADMRGTTVLRRKMHPEKARSTARTEMGITKDLRLHPKAR